jgi:hypothetical protein
MERIGLVMAFVFFAFGVYLIAHPTEGLLFFSGPGYHSIIGPDPPPLTRLLQFEG